MYSRLAPSTQVPCDSCKNLNEIISGQKEKIVLLESRLRDCVRAFKQVLAENKDIKKQLESKPPQTSTSEPLRSIPSPSKEEESRVSSLETNISELSEICGKYEKENLLLQSKLDQYAIECDNLRSKLRQSVSREVTDASIDSKESSNPPTVAEGKRVVTKNKYTQVDIYVK